MGIDISFLRIDKRKWEKEKLKSEEERRNGCLLFLRETEFFNGYKSVYELMIEVIEGFFLHKGEQLKYEKYPLLEGWEENDIVLKSSDFYDLLLEFKDRIKCLKENLTALKVSENISPNKVPEKYYPFDLETNEKIVDGHKYASREKKKNYQFGLLNFEEDIENWIKIMQTPDFKHEDYEYVISIH